MYQLSLPKIHPDGWIFIGIFAGVALVLGLISSILGFLGLVLTGWCMYFFRDPDRVVPSQEGLIVSPADGVIHAIVENADVPEEMGLKKGKWTRISIFLNVFNVHVNRVPIGGKLVKSLYHPGKFLNASLDKASQDNERQSLVVETPRKVQIGFTQVAGLIARRIRCDIRDGDDLVTGQRFGIIRFGSRADVYLPSDLALSIIVGQKAIGGETIFANLNTQDKSRLEGTIR
jgi:phosphatidylserine decarboxylase